MSAFIERLEKLNKMDTRVRAVLRRSLAFDPGAFPSAYPYVEPFVKNEGNSWRREMYYLVGGLWASHWREASRGQPLSLGAACAAHWHEKRKKGGSESLERRFIALLDSDQDQLPHRLRQMVALLKEQSIDFDALLRSLLYWNDDQKRTRNAWARDFYRNIDGQSVAEDQTETEISE